MHRFHCQFFVRQHGDPMITKIFSIRKGEVIAINGMFSFVPIKGIYTECTKYSYKNRLVNHRQLVSISNSKTNLELINQIQVAALIYHRKIHAIANLRKL